MYTGIKKRRQFILRHGHILATDDVIGRRQQLRCDPFKLLDQYLSDKSNAHRLNSDLEDWCRHEDPIQLTVVVAFIQFSCCWRYQTSRLVSDAQQRQQPIDITRTVCTRLKESQGTAGWFWNQHNAEQAGRRQTRQDHLPAAGASLEGSAQGMLGHDQ